MSQLEKSVVRKLEREGVVRTREIEALGLSRRRISQLVERDDLERVGRGLYALANRPTSANYAIAAAMKRVPRGVVCLLSALQFHSLTTQLPREVWMAIGQKDWRPASVGPPLHVVYFSPAALQEGVETHVIDGVPVQVFGVAKTVVDCFKYRNRIGIDIAIEALRECLKQRACTIDELWRFARVDRVSAIMRPYLEALA